MILRYRREEGIICDPAAREKGIASPPPDISPSDGSPGVLECRGLKDVAVAREEETR